VKAPVGAALQAIDQYMSVYSSALVASIDPRPTGRYPCIGQPPLSGWSWDRSAARL
jgi:hypothetical protein